MGYFKKYFVEMTGSALLLLIGCGTAALLGRQGSGRKIR